MCVLTSPRYISAFFPELSDQGFKDKEQLIYIDIFFLNYYSENLLNTGINFHSNHQKII